MSDQQAIEDEIAALERGLQDAKSRLATASASSPNGTTSILPLQSAYPNTSSPHYSTPSTRQSPITSLTIPPTLHPLLLLSDSALPLGSFAFSSGLESYLAHHPAPHVPPVTPTTLFNTFLALSLHSYASTSLPYLLTAYHHPAQLQTLDDEFDASTTCAVTRRSSVAQGKALLAVWERSFRVHHTPGATSSTSASTSASTSPSTSIPESSAEEAIALFSSALKSALSSSTPSSKLAPHIPHLHAHLAPLYGVLARLLCLPPHETAYIYLHSHARSLLSAAVRASVLGPYQAQSILASGQLQELIRSCLEREVGREVGEAGQSVPVLDVWAGRHELLYSRIFNS